MATYLAIVGLTLGSFGVLILVRRIHLYFIGVRVGAVFSKWEMRGLRRPAYHPVVRFTARDGNEYEVTSLAGRRPQPRIKDRYEVIYPLSAPDKGLVYSLVAYWLAPFGFFLLSFTAFYVAHDIAK